MDASVCHDPALVAVVGRAAHVDEGDIRPRQKGLGGFGDTSVGTT
jgi:hypothetical protein